MTKLEKQIQFCLRLRWVLAGGLCLFLLGFYLLGYHAQSQLLRSLNQQVALKQSSLDTSQSRAKTLPVVELEVERLKGRLDKYKKVPVGNELGPFLESMSRLRSQSGLKRWDYQPGVPRKLELVSEMPVLMNFEGDYLSIFSFLRQCEQLPRLTRVKSISLQSKDTKLGQVQVQMAMNLYYGEN